MDPKDVSIDLSEKDKPAHWSEKETTVDSSDGNEIKSEESSSPPKHWSELSDVETLFDKKPEKEAEEPKKEPLSEKQARKLLKAMDKLSGKEMEIPADAEVEVIVDGKPEKISLQDYLNGISGQKAISRKLSLLGVEQKEVSSRLTNINSVLNGFEDLRKAGKSVEALEFFLSKAGIDKTAFYQNFGAQVAPYVEQFSKLPEAERLKLLDKQKTDAVLQEREVLRQQLDQVKVREAQLAKVREVQRTHSLDDAQFAELYHSLADEVAKGTIKAPGPITPELVGEYHQMVHRERLASDVVKEVNPEKSSDPKVVADLAAAYRELEKRGMKPTKQDLVDIAKALWSIEDQKVTKKINEKISGRQKPSASSKKSDQVSEERVPAQYGWFQKYISGEQDFKF